MALQRLQKILAQAGVASRRSAERLILDGRVRVNGRVVSELGARANPQRDRVEVDGKRLVAEKPVYFLMHKPRGVVTTLDDPEGRKSVKDLLRTVPERVFPVGRLDFQTSGALLLTNDGAMAQALLHPARRVPKVYHAKIQGSLDEQRLELLRSGVTLDDGERTAPAEVDIVRKDDKHTFIEVTIHEGKNRQIHRMLDAVGRVVLRLTRLAFADLALDSLRPGQLRPLTQPELNDLKQKYLNPAKKVRRGGGGAPEPDEFDEAPPSPRRARPERGPSPRDPEPRGFDARGTRRRVPEPRGQEPRGTVDPRGPKRRVDPRGPEPRGQDPRRGVDPRGPKRRVDPRGTEPRGQDPRRGVDPRGPKGRVDPRGGVDPRGPKGRVDPHAGVDPRGPKRRVDPRGPDPRGRRDAREVDDRNARRTAKDSAQRGYRVERTRASDSAAKNGQRGRNRR